MIAHVRQTLAWDACRQRWGIEGLEEGQPLVEACQADGRSKYELSGGAPRFIIEHNLAVLPCNMINRVQSRSQARRPRASAAAALRAAPAEAARLCPGALRRSAAPAVVAAGAAAGV